MRMKRAAWLGLLLVCLLAALGGCRGLSLPEDDLVFDDEAPSLGAAVEAEPQQQRQPAKERKRGPKKWRPVEKLLGMPDAVAAVGHVFKLRIPKQAFSGNVDYYEVKGSGSRGLVNWLGWDEPAAVLYGVPGRKDLGRNKIKVKAYGRRDDVAEDSFFVHVVPENREHHGEWRKRCAEDQDRTMLTLLADAKYDNLNASDKVNALENLAGFLSLNTSSITILPDTGKEPSGSSVIKLGPGNIHRRRENLSTRIQWQVGCNGQIWTNLINGTLEIPEQARDGTLSEVLQLPVYQWRLRAEPPDFARNRRDARGGGGAEGSGNGPMPDDDEDYEEEDDDYEEEYDSRESITESPEPKHKPVVHRGGSLPEVEHPHRHHHGEDSIAGIGANINNEEDFIWRNEDVNNAIFNATPATTPSTISTSTIAVTLPSSTTTTTTTTITTTTTTTTTPTTTTSSSTTTTIEPPTSPSTSTASESPTAGSPSSPAEAEPSPTDNTTSTSQSTLAGSVETLTTETPTTYTNLTQLSTSSNSQSPSGNVSTDSLTVDVDEVLTTSRDLDNETDLDVTTPSTGLQANATEAATTTSAGVVATSGAVEVAPTSAEPNATAILTVNATADEYTEASGPTTEPSTTRSWGDNATEKVAGEFFDPYDTMNVPMYSSTPSSTSTTPSTTTSTSTTTPSTTSTTTTTTEPSTTPSTTTTTTTTTTTSEPSTTTPTTTTTTTTTTPSTTTTTSTTERIEYGILNNAPKVERRLKKIPITQGKLLSYTIPEDTFSDPEDGNTRNLRLKVYEKGAPLKPTNWLQFNEDTQEIYGLPLGDHYGSYPFEVIAMDSNGLTASDKLDISVQQHKQSRAVNHEFTIYMKIEKKSEFPTNVDWQLKVMRSLAELYGDSDLSHITVRSIHIGENDQALYTWTNDSLVRSSICPQEEINRLYNVMVTNENSEEPSERLKRVLGPEIRPKRIVYEGFEQCQQTKETQVNKYPVLRNQIDQLNATVGQLFVYRVPKDTFYDEEDGDTGSMKVSLLTANRTEIPSWDWLQFDTKAKEFYGVPLKQDIGRKTYQLVVNDREGLEATDSLVAEVHPAPVVRHVVQISMTLNMPFETFAHSAQKKREFIQKLQTLYGDKNTSAISLLSITGNRDTTTVTWRNLTLPTYECPNEDITRLRRVLVNDNKSFTDELNREFNNSSQPEFAVIQITVSQMGACQDLGVGVPELPPVDDSTSVGASHDDYLITFVLPAVIIAAMLVLAGLIACILYKRRRSGKMSVSEKDDERQSFRSKGIPVIFQDELEEKPDPGNKSPIILKEEKPPLPPPEYQRAEDGADIPMLAKENSEEPYQPPPPFATNRDNNRQNRPKPTPTYRKPPPYVPP